MTIFAKRVLLSLLFIVSLPAAVPNSIAQEVADSTAIEPKVSPHSFSDRGNVLSATFRLDGENIVRKGIAVQIGNDEEAERSALALFDTDTLRCVTGWLGDVHRESSSEVAQGKLAGMVQVVGQTLFELPNVPGWRRADETDFQDSRIEGEDGQRYGPLSRETGQWLGFYRSGNRIVWSYRAHDADILESPEFRNTDGLATFSRHFQIGPRPHDLLLNVARDSTQSIDVLGARSESIRDQVVTFKPPNPHALELPAQENQSREDEEKDDEEEDEDEDGEDEDGEDEDDEDEEEDEEDEFDHLEFDQSTFAESGTLEYAGDMSLRIAQQDAFRTTESDYTIVARIRTREGGTIFANTPRNVEYAPNSMCLFIDEDVLKLDVGWVDEVSSDHEVADGQWHVVAATYRHETGEVRLYVDGKASGSAELRPTEESDGRLVPRIGFAALDFPDDVKGFEGPISQLTFYGRTLDEEEIASFSIEKPKQNGLVAYWNRFDHDQDVLVDASGNGHHAVFEEVDFEDEDDDEEEDDEEQRIVFDGRSTRIEIPGINHRETARFSYTIGARIKTTQGGPIFSVASKRGKWKTNDISWFIRRGRLVFDMGFVGQVEGWRKIDDNKWHDIALTYNHASGEVGFIIDGEPDRIEEVLTATDENSLLPMETEDGPGESVGWIGYASEDFPEEAPKFFSGQISQLRVYAGVRNPEAIAKVMAMEPAESLGVLAAWTPSFAEDGFVEDHTENGLHGVVSIRSQEIVNVEPEFALTGCRVSGDASDANWVVSDDGDLRLRLPAGEEPLAFSVIYSPLDDAAESMTLLATHEDRLTEPVDLASMHRNDAKKAAETNLVSRSEVIGANDAAFVVERLNDFVTDPFDKPQLFSGIDFFPEQDKAVVCTLRGEVWTISGLASGPENGYQWSCIATGLHRPRGLRIVHGQIYVLGNDQITRLHDDNGDGVTDYYESFNNDAQWTSHSGSSCAGFDVDSEGNFYYVQGIPTGGEAIVPHDGTLLRVRADGASTEVVASGFGTPTGVTSAGAETFWVSGRKDRWTPAHRISRVREGQFFGHRGAAKSPADAWGQLPSIWVHHEVNPDPTGLIEVTSEKWGPLQNKLLVLSSTSPVVQILDQQSSDSFISASLFSMPIEPLPTPVSSGRFHPLDGQLYVCGFRRSDELSVADGGLFRIRYSKKRPAFPTGVSVDTTGISLEFSDSLDPRSATDWRNYAVSRWGYRTTSQVGSEDYRVSDPRRRGRDRLLLRGALLSPDGERLTLQLDDMTRADQLQINADIKSTTGERVAFTVLQTIRESTE